MPEPEALGVERLVDERVGLGVVLALDVADRPLGEVAERLLRGLAVKRLEARVLDLVLAADLLDDQLRVADQLELGGAELGGALDPQQQRPVLGDVVGRPADRLADLVDDLAVLVADHGGDRGGAGVAAGAAVDVDGRASRRSAAPLALGELQAALLEGPSAPTSRFQVRSRCAQLLDRLALARLARTAGPSRAGRPPTGTR